jgi:hypothetical protein
MRRDPTEADRRPLRSEPRIGAVTVESERAMSTQGT